MYMNNKKGCRNNHGPRGERIYETALIDKSE